MSESGNESGSCPKCRNNLGDGFGLSKCGRCGSLVFIEFDGSAKMAENSDSASSDTANESADSFKTKKAQTVSKSFSFDNVQEQTASKKTAVFDGDLFEQNQRNSKTEDNPGAAAFSPGDWSTPNSNEPATVPGVFGASTDMGIQVIDSGEVPQDAATENATAAWDPSAGDKYSENDRTRVLGEKSIADISRYSNSEVSGANQGPVLYNLVIRKIDSPDTKTNVSEVLSDSRLNLDMINVIEQIRKGQVSLRNLNPVKVHVVVKGLQSYGVEVEWSQQSVLEAVKWRILALILLTTFLIFPAGAEEEDPDSEKNQFFRISKKMSEHYARVQVLTIEVRNLIAKKRQTINRDELEVVLKSIRSKYDELKSEVVLYNAAVDELKYRFPHKGEEATKQYKAIRLDSIEVEAKESGIDLQLSELKESVTKAYEPLPPEINPLNRPKPKPLFPTTTLPKREVFEF